MRAASSSIARASSGESFGAASPIADRRPALRPRLCRAEHRQPGSDDRLSRTRAWTDGSAHRPIDSHSSTTKNNLVAQGKGLVQLPRVVLTAVPGYIAEYVPRNLGERHTPRERDRSSRRTTPLTTSCHHLSPFVSLGSTWPNYASSKCSARAWDGTVRLAVRPNVRAGVGDAGRDVNDGRRGVAEVAVAADKLYFDSHRLDARRRSDRVTERAHQRPHRTRGAPVASCRNPTGRCGGIPAGSATLCFRTWSSKSSLSRSAMSCSYVVSGASSALSFW